MRGINRIVNTSFWDDSKISDHFTPEDKYFMLYLLTNPHSTQLGIYEFPIAKASFELGYTRESVIGLLDRFENKYGVIKYSKTTNEILIKNFLRHSIVKGGKPVMDCLAKEESEVKDKVLLGYLYHHLNKYIYELNNTVIEYINTLEKYKDIDIDNDNENERIVNESWTNRQKNNETKENKPVKHKYGTYQNVLLSDADMDKLINEFPNDYKERIENLSVGIQIHGYKYKDHLAVIRNWSRREKTAIPVKSNKKTFEDLMNC